MDLNTSIRIYTLINLTIILNMFLFAYMTILIHMLTSIPKNKMIGAMLILHKSTPMATMLDMTIQREGDDGHPFIFEVMVVFILASFKPLTNLEQYNGLIDP